MKRMTCLGLTLCILLLGFACAEGNSDCLCMTEFLPETVPDLICSPYKIDPSEAMDVLMNAPYLTVDTEGHYMGTGWSNDDEEMAIGPYYISYETRWGRNIVNLVDGAPPFFTEWNGGVAKDLSFGSVEEIATLAKDILNRLNLHVELIHARPTMKPRSARPFRTRSAPLMPRKSRNAMCCFFVVPKTA